MTTATRTIRLACGNSCSATASCVRDREHLCRTATATGMNRWPPHQSVGVTTHAACCTGASRDAAAVSHQRVVRTSYPNGAGDAAWPRSGSMATGFAPITSPSLQFTTVNGWVGQVSGGGDRSRRHRLPGRFPARHCRVVPDIVRCNDDARSAPAASVMLDRRPGVRARVSQGSLTIASNSARNHSSSWQTNAQKSASTTPKPSAAPVSSRPSMPSHPLTVIQKDLLMYDCWCRFVISIVTGSGKRIEEKLVR